MTLSTSMPMPHVVTMALSSSTPTHDVATGQSSWSWPGSALFGDMIKAGSEVLQSAGGAAAACVGVAVSAF